MKQIGLMIGFLAVMVVTLPSWTAQAPQKDADKTEEKKDPVKTDDKKDPEKSDEKKTDEKKTTDKKAPKKEPEKKKAPEKLVYGEILNNVKLLSANGNNREITIEKMEIDPKKVYDLNMWINERTIQLNRQLFDLNMQTDVNARANQMIQYQRSLFDYQLELSKRQNNKYTGKPVEVRAIEKVKVRSLTPPIEFDDQGFQKKWTKKQLDARRDKTGLPGFPVELDALKPGQYVDIYFAKVAAPKTTPKKKNRDDELQVAPDRPEFVMIVILAEPK